MLTLPDPPPAGQSHEAGAQEQQGTGERGGTDDLVARIIDLGAFPAGSTALSPQD